MGGGWYDVAYLEPFNPSRKMTRWGRHVQCDRHRVIANDLPPPESQLHTHTHTHMSMSTGMMKTTDDGGVDDPRHHTGGKDTGPFDSVTLHRHNRLGG